MKNIQNYKLYEKNESSEIIDDIGLIQCINRLNTMKETGKESDASLNETLAKQERGIVADINRINAEMRWFSQWLTAKVKSAA